jgi:hypothetical protein
MVGTSIVGVVTLTVGTLMVGTSIVGVVTLTVGTLMVGTSIVGVVTLTVGTLMVGTSIVGVVTLTVGTLMVGMVGVVTFTFGTSMVGVTKVVPVTLAVGLVTFTAGKVALAATEGPVALTSVFPPKIPNQNNNPRIIPKSTRAPSKIQSHEGHPVDFFLACGFSMTGDGTALTSSTHSLFGGST